jgi:transposase-like protein
MKATPKKCPYCKSEAYFSNSPEPVYDNVGDTYQEEFQCSDCDREWIRNYTPSTDQGEDL